MDGARRPDWDWEGSLFTQHMAAANKKPAASPAGRAGPPRPQLSAAPAQMRTMRPPTESATRSMSILTRRPEIKPTDDGSIHLDYIADTT